MHHTHAYCNTEMYRYIILILLHWVAKIKSDCSMFWLRTPDYKALVSSRLNEVVLMTSWFQPNVVKQACLGD